ncbi:MAG: hypothetical protein PHU85_15520 [Phycisphaerae bacterium]|nr:hypothetical protein [Phycisphaerae bacterium]
MDDRNSIPLARIAAVAAVLAAGLAAGCTPRSGDTHLESPYLQTRVVAVVPFGNHSGSRDVDPLATSDLFFSELQMVRGFQVLPVNRSLQAMAALKMNTLSSPDDVVRLGQALGVDLVFVGVVTSYNPYNPPEVGLAVQLYAMPSRDAAGAAAEAAGKPIAQVNEIYSAKHQIVQKQIREFAEIRGGKDSPLGWQLYTKSIQEFMRFCCHRAIVQTLQLEQGRIWTESAAGRP